MWDMTRSCETRVWLICETWLVHVYVYTYITYRYLSHISVCNFSIENRTTYETCLIWDKFKRKPTWFRASSVCLCHFPLKMLRPPKSTKSRNSDSSEFRGTNSNRDWGLIWICTEAFESLDLVDFGGVAFSVDTVLWPWSLVEHDITWWNMTLLTAREEERKSPHACVHL